MKCKHFVLFLAVWLAACAPSITATPSTVSTESTATNLPETSPSMTSSPTNTPVLEPQWVYLSDLQPDLAKAGYWTVANGKYPASEGSMVKGQTIHNGARNYPHGLFAAAPSNLRYALDGHYQTFTAEIFIDPSMICEADGALFQVYLDGDLLYSQHTDTPRQAPSEVQSISLDIRGGKQLLLHTDPGENGDIACDATIWGEAALLTDPTPIAAIPPDAPLEQQPMLFRELERFTAAMHAAGVIKAEQTLTFADVQTANFKDLRGTPFKTAFVHLDPDPAQTGEAFEGDYPLLISEDGQWQTVGLRFWAEANQMDLAVPIIANDSELDDPTYPLQLLHENATQLVLYVNISPAYVFADFKAETWRQVLDNWETVKGQLDQGSLPDGYSFHWEGADRVIELANEMKMDVRAGEVLPTAFSVPQEIVDGQFKQDELEKLFEFMLKVPVIKYRGKVDAWLVVSESTGWLSSGRGPEKSWGFPFLQLGGTEIIEKAYGWADEADPDAALILTDDHILLDRMVSDYGLTQPHWNQVFFETLAKLKARNTPLDAIDIENNFWIYNPPNPIFMRSQLERIQALGYSIYAPEVTVLVSEAFPYPSTQSQQQVKVANPLAAQAVIYQQTLQSYLDLGIPWFGLGGLTDRFSFWRYSGFPEAHAMIFDYNQQPKAAYYLLVSIFYAHLKGK